MRKTTTGFTIVELLIVIVVIAILAAITIIAYNGIQNRANDGAVQQDLTTMAKKLELYKIDSPTSAYPTNTSAALTPLNIKLTKSSYASTNNPFIYCVTNTSLVNYGIIGVSKSGKAFTISSTSPTVTEYINTPVTSGVAACGDMGITSAWWLWGYGWAG